MFRHAGRATDPVDRDVRLRGLAGEIPDEVRGGHALGQPPDAGQLCAELDAQTVAVHQVRFSQGLPQLRIPGRGVGHMDVGVQDGAPAGPPGPRHGVGEQGLRGQGVDRRLEECDWGCHGGCPCVTKLGQLSFCIGNTKYANRL